MLCPRSRENAVLSGGLWPLTATYKGTYNCKSGNSEGHETLADHKVSRICNKLEFVCDSTKTPLNRKPNSRHPPNELFSRMEYGILSNRY